MNPNFRNFALWVIIFLLVVALVLLFQNPGQRVQIAGDYLQPASERRSISRHVCKEVTIAGKRDLPGQYTDNRGAFLDLRSQ